MASFIGRMGLAGGTGAHRTVRKGTDRAFCARGSSCARAGVTSSLKALRKEDVELLKEAEGYMSAEEQAELRRLLEENQRLRQAVTSHAGHLSPQQLEVFTAEYSRLAREAEATGVAVEEAALRQAALSAAGAGAAAPRSSSGARLQEAASAAGGADLGLGGSRSYAASVLLADPPAPPPAAVAAEPVVAAHAEAHTNGSPSSSFGVSSRAYARDMASLSVELDGSSDEEEGQGQGQGGNEHPSEQTEVTITVPEASTRTRTSSISTLVAAAEPFTSASIRPVPIGISVPTAGGGGGGIDPSQAQLLEAREAALQHTGADPEAEEARKAALRSAAAAEVAAHDPSAVVAGREHWMIITVPEKPVAGAPMVLYFNRNQSDKLRHRPRVACQFGFNRWELVPEGAGGNQADLQPAPLPKNDASDFWRCTLQVPEETCEVNFILTDAAGTYENNNGMDFTFGVEGGISYDAWIDTAAERAVAKELARREAEAKAAEEARRQAVEAMHNQARDYGTSKAEELKSSLTRLQEGSTTALTRPDGVPVFRLLPPGATPSGGGQVVLQYNRKAGPLASIPIPQDQTITLLFGFNGWQGGGKAVMQRVEPGSGEAPEDWFQAEVAVPREALAVNFVFNYYERYDNNGGKDFKVPVSLPPGMSLDVWGEAVSKELGARELARRLAEQQAAEEKQRRMEVKKKVAQDLVKAVERRKVRHVLFTDPEVVAAGREVTVCYNPRDTPLAGRQQIYLMGGWNRWTHRRHFGPIAMHPPAEGGEHWQATVPVPKDAFKMDFVFADVPGGDGTYDNRGGYDYHLPVEGSPVREAPLHVCHIAVEMAPIAKVGGLGDVVTALGRAVKEQGHLVEVLLPRYDFFLQSPVLREQLRYETEFDWGGTRVFVTTAEVENLRVFFIEPRNGFFATPTVYGRYDDEVRFDFFCKAALEFLLKTGRQPDILHCHDWSTAHVAQSYWADYHPYGLHKPRVVFTIHNLNYGQKKIGEAAHSCQKFTTVSPTYAFEVCGNPVIAPHVHKFLGIRNGIDPELWSPEDNQFLPLGYSAESVVEGKKAARQALRQRLNLTNWNDKFIVAVVSRLTGQKGVPLIKHAAFRTVDRGGQFVLLGSAPDPRVQADFDALAGQMGGQDAAFCFKYDEPLSHLIYAAADMIVVPSMFEPCGLTQMIAMRYGTVPIVRHTGGLHDTVFDVDFDKERAAWELYGSSDWQRDNIDATNGFAFAGTDGGALDYALNRAIDAWYNDRAWFHGLQRRIMEQDWSWNRPALDYIELYFSALKS